MIAPVTPRSNTLPAKPLAETEQCFSPKQVAGLWAVSERTIMRIFQDEPGVLKLNRKRLLRGRRSHVTLRIPKSVLDRVARRLAE